VTLTNTGNITLNITSIVSSSKTFPLSNRCGSTLGAGNSCTFQVEFKPTTAGTSTGTITLTDNAPGSPQTVPLTGTGTVVSFSPTSLSFGTVNVGSSSAPQNVTMTNNSGGQTMSITGISITGANASSFSEINNCGGSLGPGASCTITVTFTPTTSGPLTANVSVADNGGGSPQTVPLSGTGQGTGKKSFKR
jgi:hypothetical protein